MKYKHSLLFLCLFVHLYVHIFPYPYLLWSPLSLHIRYTTCDEEIFATKNYILYRILHFYHPVKLRGQLQPSLRNTDSKVSTSSSSLSHDVHICVFNSPLQFHLISVICFIFNRFKINLFFLPLDLFFSYLFFFLVKDTNRADYKIWNPVSLALIDCTFQLF